VFVIKPRHEEDAGKEKAVSFGSKNRFHVPTKLGSSQPPRFSSFGELGLGLSAKWANLKHVLELIVPWPFELMACPPSLKKPSPLPGLRVEPSEWSLAVPSSSLLPTPSETPLVPIAENPTPPLKL
jgi:hypothetical protein